MIDLIFYHGTDLVFVRVEGHTLKFTTSLQSNKWASIDGLKLDYSGVIREFPELENEENWREEAIFRLKSKLQNFKTEDDVVIYVIDELKKYGYIPKYKMKKGHRREVIK